MGMPTLVDFWLSVVASLITTLFVTIMATNFFHILQLSGYKLKGYTDYFKQTKFASIGRLAIISILAAGAMVITNVLLEQLLVGRALKYASIIFFFIFCLVYVVNMYGVPQKTPIKYTKRMTRLIIVFAIICFVSGVALQYLTVLCVPYFTAGGVLILPLLLPVFVIVTHGVTLPVENIISKSYIKRAKAKLLNYPNLKVVGVTGSYGKTTVKNIIASILAEKYKVCVSPFSYNTPLGLTKTILENLNADDQILVCEMGARNPGDIAELCEMVRPDIGVITGIGNQHLATFKTVENLINTKAELARFIEKHDGYLVVNVESGGAKQIFDKTNCAKIAIGGENSSIVAENIVATKDGSKFELVIGGKRVGRVETVLLGEHNVSNILLAVAVAQKLGLSEKEIVDGIKRIIPVSHRLAIVPSNNALVVIDDAYNGSVEGTKSALNVLSKFEGRKVVITPGLVELGNEQFNANFEFGRDMAKVSDYVIVTGVINWEAISTGLEFAGFDKTKIIRAGSLNQAVSMLPSITNPGDVVLFENDLPDNYL